MGDLARPRVRASALLVLVALTAVAACSAHADPRTAPERPHKSPTAVDREPRGQEPRQREARAPRPNLLVIETDDMRADDLQWMPRTRRLLADKGLTWHNSFAPDPLCCPSRASFLTGQYSHNHGVLSHEAPYGFRSFRDEVTLATVLQDAGYRTALVGKYLNNYGTPPENNDDSDDKDGRDESYVPPGWTRWLGALDYWVDGDGGYRGSTYDYFHLAANVDGELMDWPGEYSTNVLGELTREVVADFGQQPRRPWFVWWTPTAPHHGTPIEADDPPTRYRPDGTAAAWLTPARPEEVEGHFDDVIGRGLGVPADGGSEPDLTDKPRYLSGQEPLGDADREALTEVTRQRAEALLVLDQEVGRTLAELRASGQADRTIVVFTSDNGYYLGEHGKRQGKITLHEPSIRVPLLMAGPGVPRGDRYDPISTVDLAVTLAGWAGATLPRADGTDLRPAIIDGDQGWDRPMVLEGRMLEGRYLNASDRRPLFGGLGALGFRTGRWKYVRYATGERELYDLQRDPLELASIASPSARLQRVLDRTWRRFVGCVAQDCRDRLPKELRLDAEELRELTRHQETARERYYG